MSYIFKLTVFWCTVVLPLPDLTSALHLPPQTECGVSSLPKRGSRPRRIVGGVEFEHGEHPWLVGVGKFDNASSSFTINCGGSLITSRHVLTAANCFSRRTEDNPNVVILGEHDVDAEGERPTPLIVAIADSKNPGYNSIIQENDIQLITLEEEVAFTDFIQPICLPSPDQVQRSDLTGDVLTIVGWGTTSFESHSSTSVPLQADVPFIPNSECNQAYEQHVRISITDNMMCLGGNGKDACKGDSGSPAIYREGGHNQNTLMGITAFGVGCGNPKFPGVYTYVPSYLQWIHNNM